MKRISLTASIVFVVFSGTLPESQAGTIHCDGRTASALACSFRLSGSDANVAFWGTLADIGPFDFVLPVLLGRTRDLSITLTEGMFAERLDWHVEIETETASAYEASKGRGPQRVLERIFSDRFGSHAPEGSERDPDMMLAFRLHDAGIPWYNGAYQSLLRRSPDCLAFGLAIRELLHHPRRSGMLLPDLSLARKDCLASSAGEPLPGPGEMLPTTLQAIPEPSARLLFVSGLSALCAIIRKLQKSRSLES